MSATVIQIQYPLRIQATPAAYRINDAAERNLAYVYFETDSDRHNPERKTLTRTQAEALAKRIARLLTDHPV